MSEMLTVPTAFENIPDLSAGLIDRVDSDQIVLYGPTPYEPGTTIEFSVLLLDGTPGFEGRGIVMESIDGGEDRDDSIRFDIVLVSLELGEEAADIFEAMVLERQLLAGDDGAFDVEDDAYEEEEPAGLIEEPAEALEDAAPAESAQEIDEASAELADAEDAPEESVAADDLEGSLEEALEEAEATEEDTEEAPAAQTRTEWDSDSETVVSMDSDLGVSGVDHTFDDGFGDASEDVLDASSEMDASEDEIGFGEQNAVAPSLLLPQEIPPPDDAFRGALPPDAPGDPGGFSVTNELVDGLMRPVQQDVWTPIATERPEPRPSSGLFQYADGLPVPSAPPRPVIDESLVVTRAPHPSDNERDFEETEVPLFDDPYEAITVKSPEYRIGDEIEAEEVEAEAIDSDEAETLETEAYEDAERAQDLAEGAAKDPIEDMIEDAESEAIEAADYAASEPDASYDEAIEYGEVESRD